MTDIIDSVVRPFELALGWVFSSSWLPPQDFEFMKWLIVPGAGYGIILIAFAVLELLIPAERRPWSRATWLSATYLLLSGKMTLYLLVVAPLIQDTWNSAGLPSLHLDHQLPRPLFVLIGVLVATFISYWAHRLNHRFRPLWHIHKIHHAPANLNWTTIYNIHFLELILLAPLMTVSTMLLGSDNLAPFGVIFMTVDVLGHANIRLDFRWLNYVISTPQAHRIHHSIDPRHHDTNFGNCFMIWDHVFGTFLDDRRHPPTRYGLDEAIPTGFLKQQILPLAWIARDLRARFFAGRPAAPAAVGEGALTDAHPGP